jgi:hypothetical protein
MPLQCALVDDFAALGSAGSRILGLSESQARTGSDP